MHMVPVAATPGWGPAGPRGGPLMSDWMLDELARWWRSYSGVMYLGTWDGERNWWGYSEDDTKIGEIEAVVFR